MAASCAWRSRYDSCSRITLAARWLSESCGSAGRGGLVVEVGEGEFDLVPESRPKIVLPSGRRRALARPRPLEAAWTVATSAGFLCTLLAALPRIRSPSCASCQHLCRSRSGQRTHLAAQLAPERPVSLINQLKASPRDRVSHLAGAGKPVQGVFAPPSCPNICPSPSSSSHHSAKWQIRCTVAKKSQWAALHSPARKWPKSEPKQLRARTLAHPGNAGRVKSPLHAWPPPG